MSGVVEKYGARYRYYGLPVRAIIADPSPDIRLEDLSRRIETLRESIQSISILPAYPDGSILAKDDTLCINCAVTPAEAVMSLQESDFRILLNLAQTVQTKVGNLYVADKFTEFTQNPENGTLMSLYASNRLYPERRPERQDR